MVPVHADDHRLLGIRWLNKVFVDTALPFGLCSAPKLFLAFANALAWVLYKKGVVWQLQWNLRLKDKLVHRPMSAIRRLPLIGEFLPKILHFTFLSAAYPLFYIL